jgi:predicted aspartyl protease
MAEPGTRPLLSLVALVGVIALSGCGAGTPRVSDGAAAPKASLQHAEPTCPMAARRGEVTVPLKTISQEVDTVETPVCIGGHGPYDFIIDTGAAGTLVTTQLARRLGLPVAGPSVSFGGAGCRGTTHAVRLPSLSVGGRIDPGGSAYTIHARGLGGPNQPQGALGASTLAALGALRLDYRHRELGIGPPIVTHARLPIARHSDIPATWLARRPRIRAPLALVRRGEGLMLRTIVTLGDLPPQAWLPDTGAQFSILDRSVARTAQLSYLRRPVVQPSSCSTRPLYTHLAWSGSWHLDGQRLRPQALQVTGLRDTVLVDGIIGAKTFAEYGSDVFDWGGRQLLLGVG